MCVCVWVCHILKIGKYINSLQDNDVIDFNFKRRYKRLYLFKNVVSG